MSTTIRNSPSRQTTPGTWKNVMAAQINARCGNIDSDPLYSSLADNALDFIATDGTVSDAGGQDGNLYLGLFTGVNGVRPKYGTASFFTSIFRAFPFAIATRGAPVLGGATVTHALCMGRTASNRLCFGYKGSLSTTLYQLWTEDNAGTVLKSVASTASVSLMAAAPPGGNQNFVIIFNGTTVEAFYSAPDVYDHSLTLVATLSDISDLPLNSGMFPCAFNRTAAAGTEYCVVSSLMAMTMTPR